MNHKFNVGDSIRFIRDFGGGIFKKSLFIPQDQVLKIDDIRYENGIWKYGFETSILRDINSKNKRIIDELFLNSVIRFNPVILYFDVKDIENNCVKEYDYKVGDRINFCEHFPCSEKSIKWGYIEIKFDTRATITKVEEFMYTLTFFNRGEISLSLPKDFVDFYSHKMDDQETSDQDVKFHIPKFEIGDIIVCTKPYSNSYLSFEEGCTVKIERKINNQFYRLKELRISRTKNEPSCVWMLYEKCEEHFKKLNYN